MTSLTQKVVVKLGVEKKDGGGDVLFRRVNLSQHERYHEDLFSVLKLYSIQTYTGGDVLPGSVTGYRVNFIYVDMDGDRVMIGSSEELMDALRMHEGAGVIKIVANVEQRDEEPLVEERPSVPEEPVPAPSTPAAVGSRFVEEVQPQIQHILESVVAQIASIPAVMHLQVRGSGQARPAPPNARAPHTSTEPTLSPAPERPFIHGRHTCDACLTTPIIGQRFHALNLPDYDLCASCRNNYKGDEIQFKPVELDRDRAFQDRWHRRFMRCSPPHRPHGPPHPPCGPPRPPHGPPPPPHCGPHPHWGPRHGRRGPHGPHRRWGCHALYSPIPAEPSPEEVDMALKEAIRRSLVDLKATQRDTGKQAVPAERETVDEEERLEPSAPEDPVQMVDHREMTDMVTPDTSQGAVEASQEEPPSFSPVVTQDKSKTTAAPSSPSKMSDTSFEEEAEGNGDIAKLVGSTLDKFAAAIDDFNNEFDRALNASAEQDIVVEGGHGAEIVTVEDASDDELSQGSWVVDEEQFANDEALARAAHVIGSALFQSDMVQSTQSGGNVSALSQSDNGSKSSASTSDGPSLAPSAISVPTNPGSISHCQMDRWAFQLNELHGMGLDDDAKIVEILERLTAANLGSDCDDEIPIERIVDEYYK